MDRGVGNKTEQNNLVRFSIESIDQRMFNISQFNATLEQSMDNGDDDDEDGEDGERDGDNRMQSLEALRYALHHAPFCRDKHRLMSIPGEEFFEMQGIPTKCAIRIERLYYENLLENINLDVPKGKIYALLGSANNGKSCLLKCITGRLKPTSGTIVTFGSSSTGGSPLSAICVGYMPQALCLHEELSVGQTLYHYGRLYQLELFILVERISFLCSMLNLPDNNLLVKHLNPGQKWRISLAIALIHSPPLLLLDEPTVNVDPLIRSSIWHRLSRLCDEEGLTILVTTKYPEEISFAYKVGLMRDGHIYIEDHPDELRRYYGCETYDQLYTKFCMSNVPRRVRPSIAPYLMVQSGKLEQSPNTIISEQSELSTDIGSQFSLRIQSKMAGDSGSSPDTSHRFKYDSSESDNQASVNRFPLFNNLTTTSATTKTNSDCQSYEYTSHHSIEPQSLPHFSGDDISLSSTRSDCRIPSQMPMAEWPICERRRTAYMIRFINFDLKRLLTLVLKNMAIMRGNLYPILIFYFLFPALQAIFVCFIFGRNATNIPVTVPAKIVTNNRLARTLVNSLLWSEDASTADNDNQQQLFKPAYMPTTAETIRQIELGQSIAAIVPWTFVERDPSNVDDGQPLMEQSSTVVYSQNNSSQTVSSRVGVSSLCQHLFNYQIENAHSPSTTSSSLFGVRIYLDNSNYILAQQMFHSLIYSMKHFLQSSQLDSMLSDCPEQIPSVKTQSAIDIAEVIYGSTKFGFLEFLMPGFVVSIIFAYSLILTAYLFIKEHHSGLHERCFITGTSGFEVLAAHFISQTKIFILQELLLLLIVLRLFGLPSQGPLYSLWLLIFLQGLVGISFGLFVAVITPNPFCAALFTSVIFIPAFFFSGIVWPIESMPLIARHLSHALPLTMPINSLRYIISRGPDMYYSQIISGFTISLLYIGLLLMLTVAIYKYKTSS